MNDVDLKPSYVPIVTVEMSLHILNINVLKRKREGRGRNSRQPMNLKNIQGQSDFVGQKLHQTKKNGALDSPEISKFVGA
jgi:hypothetical protein